MARANGSLGDPAGKILHPNALTVYPLPAPARDRAPFRLVLSPLGRDLRTHQHRPESLWRQVFLTLFGNTCQPYYFCSASSRMQDASPLQAAQASNARKRACTRIGPGGGGFRPRPLSRGGTRHKRLYSLPEQQGRLHTFRQVYSEHAADLVPQQPAAISSPPCGRLWSDSHCHPNGFRKGQQD
jgi:hypothetical protein